MTCVVTRGPTWGSIGVASMTPGFRGGLRLCMKGVHMRIVLGIVLVAAMVAAALPANAADIQRRQSMSAADAEEITRRLYQGILGREADSEGLRSNAAGLRRSGVEAIVRTLVESDEFANGPGGKSPRQLLNQFYRGLLGRNPDSAGVSAFMPRMDRAQYVSVVTEMVNSNEFQNALGSGGSSSGSVNDTPSVNTLDAALECQGRVINRVRDDAGGRIFLTFDRLPDVSADGRDIRGPGVDRFMDLDRQMTYRCNGGNVTYSYSDRRSPVAYDREQFPSGAVRNCQQAVRGGLTFDAASLSATDTNTEYVLGIAGGRVYRCTMDLMRVVSVK